MFYFSDSFKKKDGTNITYIKIRYQINLSTQPCKQDQDRRRGKTKPIALVRFFCDLNYKYCFSLMFAV